MDKREQAGQDYSAGMKYKDISAKYDVPVNTLKSWRTRDHWKRGAPATNEVHPKQKKDAPKVAPKIVDELEANNKLTEKQKLFCLFYLQRFNATWAYMKSYNADYPTANANGARLLVNASVQKQITGLKRSMMNDIHLTAEDLAQQYAKQAFADLGDYIDFGTREEIVRDGWYKPVKDKITGGYLKTEKSFVHLKDKDSVDTSLLKGVRIGRDGVVVELYDKQKALDSLARIAGADDMTKQKIRKLKAEADIANYKAKLLTDPQGVEDRTVLIDDFTEDNEKTPD